MTGLLRSFARPAALAALLGLAGCVGAPVGEPVAYGQPGYAQQPPGYAPAAPGYAPAQQGYAPAPPGYAPAAAAQGYAPPPYGYGEQAPAREVAYGGRCYAGVYTCALAQATPVGAQCSCPALGAPSYGVVR